MIDQEQKTRLEKLTRHWLQQGEAWAGRALAPLAVRFDLCGRAAGQYRSHPQPLVRYNAALAARQFDDFCRLVPPHEVAHHVVSQLHGPRGARPHGPEWQAVMNFFGVPAERCHDFDLDGTPVRRQRRFLYRCACGEQQLSATRHNRIQRGEATYFCRRCGEPLRPVQQEI